MTIISLNDRPVAVVVDDQAVLTTTVAAGDAPLINGMCLYAMQIADGERPGPYRDADALEHAKAMLGRQRRNRCGRFLGQTRRRPCGY